MSSRVKYLRGLPAVLAEGDFIRYQTISRALIVNLFIFSKTVESLDSLKESFIRCQNLASPNVGVGLSIINFLVYSYPLCRVPRRVSKCRQSSLFYCPRLEMQSLFAAQPFLLDNIMAFAQAYIMAQLVNLFTPYPRLSYCLVAGSAFSAAAIVSNVLGYPMGSYAAPHSLSAGSYVVRSILTNRNYDKPDPSWLVSVLEIFSK